MRPPICHIFIPKKKLVTNRVKRDKSEDALCIIWLSKTKIILRLRLTQVSIISYDWSRPNSTLLNIYRIRLNYIFFEEITSSTDEKIHGWIGALMEIIDYNRFNKLFPLTNSPVDFQFDVFSMLRQNLFQRLAQLDKIEKFYSFFFIFCLKGPSGWLGFFLNGDWWKIRDKKNISVSVVQ